MAEVEGKIAAHDAARPAASVDPASLSMLASDLKTVWSAPSSSRGMAGKIFHFGQILQRPLHLTCRRNHPRCSVFKSDAEVLNHMLTISNGFAQYPLGTLQFWRYKQASGRSKSLVACKVPATRESR